MQEVRTENFLNYIFKLVSYEILLEIMNFISYLESKPCIAQALSGGSYLLKVNSRNTRTKCEIYSKLAVIPERRYWLPSGLIIVNFGPILDINVVFQFMTLYK